MPELYVGNISKQIQHFAYRAVERNGVVVQPIQMGSQIMVAPYGTRVDLTPQEIDYIIDQHRMYGMVPIEEVDISQHPFSGLCYSIGKPITSEQLHKAIAKKEEALRAMGKKTREEAALAVNNQIEGQIGRPLNQLEMSFEEEEPRGGYAADLDHIAEGVVVSRNEGRRFR